MICWNTVSLLNAGYKKHNSAAQCLFLASCWPALPLVVQRTHPAYWPGHCAFKQLLRLDEAPAPGTAAGVHFGSKGPRPSGLTTCTLIQYHHQLLQQQVPLWREREKLFGEESDLYKEHYGPGPQLVHAQFNHVLSLSCMSNAHIHQWKNWPALSAASLFSFPRNFSPIFALHRSSFKKERKSSCLLLQSKQLQVTSYTWQTSLPSLCHLPWPYCCLTRCVSQSCLHHRL